MVILPWNSAEETTLVTSTFCKGNVLADSTKDISL